MTQISRSESETSGILSWNVETLQAVWFLLDSLLPTCNAWERNGVPRDIHALNPGSGWFITLKGAFLLPCPHLFHMHFLQGENEKQQNVNSLSRINGHCSWLPGAYSCQQTALAKTRELPKKNLVISSEILLPRPTVVFHLCFFRRDCKIPFPSCLLWAFLLPTERSVYYLLGLL